MAITTLDGVLAGMNWPRFFAKAVTATLVAGRPASLWSLAGSPGAGSFDTTLNGVTLSGTSSQVAGQIPYTDPGAGNSYLARFSGNANQAGVLVLCDRLWHNGGFTITSTSQQAITSPTWPARDAAGATNGDGVLLGLEISAATGAGVPTLTADYTNSAGTASHTGTNVQATLASSAIGAFYQIGLQAGDIGVKSVQHFTLSATWTSGTMNLVAYRPIAQVEIANTFTPGAVDALTSGFPQLYNGFVPFLLFIPQTTTASTISGQFIYATG